MDFIAYTPEQLVDRLVEVVVDGKRHQDYKRVTEVAEWSLQVMTGDDQRELLVLYKTREDPDQKEQRVRVTNSRTQYISNKVFNLYSEPHRADRTVNSMSYTGEEKEEVLAGLKENLGVFAAGRDLETYLDERFKYLNFYDPNAFLVVEFDNINPEVEKPTAYPFEVTSPSAVDFEYQRGSLQYLVAEIVKTTKNDDGKVVEYSEFTMYAPRITVKATVIPPDVKGFPISETATIEAYDVEGQEAKVKVMFDAFENGSETTPAFRVGVYRDPTTALRTFVSPLYPAEKLILDLIWSKSEYDLSKALHGFYQKFMYVDICPKCEGDGYSDAPNGGDRECPKCGGTGKDSHLTVQDIIEVSRPDSREDHIPLNEFIHYEAIPMELIKLQKEDVGDLEDAIFNCIFGSNVLDRTEIAVTATEKRFDWRAVNNTLAPYADGYVDLYKAIVFQVATHRQEREGLVLEYAFPSDFNLESINDLIIQRGAAVTAGSPAPILKHIDLNIVHKQNKDNPLAVQAYRVKESFRPFQGKPLQEIIFLVNTLGEEDHQRVMYLNFDPIMNTLILDVDDFLFLSTDVQRALVDKAIEEVIEANKVPLFDPLTGGVPATEDSPSAALRGSVGGVTGLINIANAVAAGQMTESAAVAILQQIYELDEEAARKIASPPSGATGVPVPE